jgi:hypothetical protein
MRGLSSCRSQYTESVLALVRNEFKDIITDKVQVQAMILGDRFMYATDAKV